MKEPDPRAASCPALAGTTRIPIARLAPSLENPAQYSIRAILALIWPYSSARGVLSLLLVEPETLLRRDHGEVRVHLAGPSVRGFSEANVACGDEVRLGLEGAAWTTDPTLYGTPGCGIDYDLRFSGRLLLEVSAPQAEPPVLSPSSTSQPPTPPPTRSVADQHHATGAGPQEWSSPAFLKRSSFRFGSFPDSTLDPFAAEEDQESRDRKRAKFGSLARPWTYAAEDSASSDGRTNRTDEPSLHSTPGVVESPTLASRSPEPTFVDSSGASAPERDVLESSPTDERQESNDDNCLTRLDQQIVPSVSQNVRVPPLTEPVLAVAHQVRPLTSLPPQVPPSVSKLANVSSPSQQVNEAAQPNLSTIVLFPEKDTSGAEKWQHVRAAREVDASDAMPGGQSTESSQTLIDPMPHPDKAQRGEAAAPISEQSLPAPTTSLQSTETSAGDAQEVARDGSGLSATPAKGKARDPSGFSGWFSQRTEPDGPNSVGHGESRPEAQTVTEGAPPAPHGRVLRDRRRQPAAGNKLATASPAAREPSPETAGTGQADERLGILGQSLVTPLASFATLSSLSKCFGDVVDVLVIAQGCEETFRSRGGPRDWRLTLHAIDPSIAPETTTVQIFRVYEEALPYVEVGDGILLRGFKVFSSRRKLCLVSSEESAWVTWDKDGVEEMTGPPVEFGKAEREHVRNLRSWWAGGQASPAQTRTKQTHHSLRSSSSLGYPSVEVSKGPGRGGNTIVRTEEVL
ncbi:MAG: hypothetical protein M1838_002449 [Thelocarpon superellum]|nr:MAG: hypothetical protein M1838_002449 [Thelocarpon superellum]